MVDSEFSPCFLTCVLFNTFIHLPTYFTAGLSRLFMDGILMFAETQQVSPVKLNTASLCPGVPVSQQAQ